MLQNDDMFTSGDFLKVLYGPAVLVVLALVFGVVDTVIK